MIADIGSPVGYGYAPLSATPAVLPPFSPPQLHHHQHQQSYHQFQPRQPKPQKQQQQPQVFFQELHSGASCIFGPNRTVELLLEQDEPFAHEAAVFFPSKDDKEDDSLWVTSSLIEVRQSGGKQNVTWISRVALPRDGSKPSVERIKAPEVRNPNGGINYLDGIVFCAQGSRDAPGGLALLDPASPGNASLLVKQFGDSQFNSPNDVVADKNGSLWFTDPMYGFEQGFRPESKLNQQVYLYDPKEETIRVVADGFGRPNGLAFSPDQKVLYVSDTDYIHGDGSTDPARASTIYAFDVEERAGQPILKNKSVFAKAEKGIPDGIKTDMQGNVYSGCGDGVNIWSPGGVLLGKISVGSKVANLCFGREGKLYILAETRIWTAQLAPGVRGSLLGI